jgi:RNA polymerase-binding transcription factor DksA
MSDHRLEPSPAADIERLDVIGAELEAVDAALERLDDGSYGQCVVCGEPVGDDRLAADPLALRCAAHNTAGPL